MAVLETRRLPLRNGVNRRVEMDYRVQLPARARIVRSPSSFDESSECLAVHQDVTRERGALHVSAWFESRCPEVSVEDYPALRRLVQSAVSQLQSELVFR